MDIQPIVAAKKEIIYNETEHTGIQKRRII